MYHIVDERIDSPIAVTEDAFEAQLAHLRGEGYTVLTLEDVLRIVRDGAPSPTRGVFLTFDDGYADNLYTALPRLREHDVEATMFVPTAYVGGPDEWNARPEYGLRHLDWHELEQWLAGGGRIGAHTHGHEAADAIGPEGLRRSIEVSHELLERHLGIAPSAFAYPNGISTPEAHAEVSRRYEIAWTVNGGTWYPRRDRFLLNRYGVARHLTVFEFARELDGLFEALTRGRRPSRVVNSVRPVARRPTPAAYTVDRRGPRIVLVAEPREGSLGYPPGLRFADLLDAGWDAHFVHPGGRVYQSGIDDLPDDVLRSRVHPPPPKLQRLLPRPRVVVGLLRAFLRRPLRVVAALARGVDPATRYLRASVLAVRPEVVDLSMGTADGWSQLKRALGARFVVEADGPATWAVADAAYAEDEEPWATVIPRAIDPRLLEWSPARPGSFLRVLAIGPLTWHQGYEHLLQAIRLLTDRGVPCGCRIVGSGGDHSNALSFARHQLELDGNAEVFAAGSRPDLLQQLRWAEVVVNPAVEPTLPPWLADAQAAARPVVTTPLPDGHELPALFVPPGDAEALADSLESLAGDQALRGRLAVEGRRHAGTLPPMSAQLEGFRDLYLSVLNPRTFVES